MKAGDLACRASGNGVEFEVVVSAGASRSGVRGVHGTGLKVSVRAAPERGRANAEVVEVVAAFLGVPARRVSVTAGAAARHKRIRVEGLDPGAVRRAVEAGT